MMMIIDLNLGYEIWIVRLAAILGAVTLLVAVLGFRRLDLKRRARSSGQLASWIRWPMMLILTVLFIGAGYVLWRPVFLNIPVLLRFSLRVLGALIYFPAIALYLWGFMALGDMFGLSSGFGVSLYEGHRLIQRGPYRYVRHPMYLAVILAAIGALLIFQTWALALFVPLSFGILARARREEALLSQEFGEEWEDYCSRVPGWLPKISRGDHW